MRDVRVRWPDGRRERFGDVAGDKIAVLRRGSGIRIAKCEFGIVGPGRRLLLARLEPDHPARGMFA